MPTWAWVLVALGAAVVAGVAVYIGWLYWAIKQFNNTDL